MPLNQGVSGPDVRLCWLIGRISVYCLQPFFIMKFYGIALFLFLLVAGSLQGRQLVFESTDIEIESSLMDDQATAVFRFTNESDRPAVITRLKSSCGCTVPELEKREYAPGESGEIIAVFKFGHRRGIQHKRVTVLTPEETFQLSLKTEIPEWGKISPQILRWSIGNDKDPKEVKLRIPSSNNIELIEPDLEMKHFTVTDVRPGKNEWTFTVIPKDTAARATERATLQLRVTDGTAEAMKQMAFHCLIR